VIHRQRVSPPGFDEYVRMRYADLRRLAFLLSGHWASADDIVQTALIRCEKRWSMIQDPDQHPYVRRAVVNTSNSWRIRRRVHASLDEVAGVTFDDDGSTEDRLSVLGAVRRLPLGQRQVLVLRFYEGLSEAEIARILDISAGTVKSRCSRALAALRDSDLQALVNGGTA
jgi:RNA polymerase sigma-70 factor (ECF subfamily)